MHQPFGRFSIPNVSGTATELFPPHVCLFMSYQHRTILSSFRAFWLPRNLINAFHSIASISPDGRTLLSVGDSNKVYFHQITGGARISFAPITTLSIPPPDASPRPFSSSSLAAAFSTAFSGDGTKFAVASQEGVVAVWDVRSTKPVKVFQTDKTRGMGGGPGTGSGGATGWLSDDPWEWTRGTKAPGWCVRSVKFNGGEGARLGKEVMAFTEVSMNPFAALHKYLLFPIAHIPCTYRRCTDVRDA